MKDKYIFFSDLDGTLLTKEKKITQKTMEALSAFADAGNKFAVCTGRDITSAIKAYQGLGINLKGSYVVAYNGGLIYDVDNDEIIFREGIPVDLARELLDMAKEYNLHAHTYNDSFVLTESYNECVDFYRRVIKTPFIVAEDITEFLIKPPCKIICIELHDHEKQERFRQAVLEKYSDQIDSMYSNSRYLELIPKNSGKGNALKRLRDIIGVAPENVIAAGDGENDISMIKEAGIGVAMINAPENVRNAADIVTNADNDHDGLADILFNYRDLRYQKKG